MTYAKLRAYARRQFQKTAFAFGPASAGIDERQANKTTEHADPRRAQVLYAHWYRHKCNSRRKDKSFGSALGSAEFLHLTKIRDAHVLAHQLRLVPGCKRTRADDFAATKLT